MKLKEGGFKCDLCSGANEKGYDWTFSMKDCGTQIYEIELCCECNKKMGRSAFSKALMRFLFNHKSKFKK